jgi:3-isopropylmalate/(R)-2-methylmalate dehydratase small subunit
VAHLFDEVAAFPGYALTIDLERQFVIKPDGEELPFEVQAFRKYCLLNGLDDIGLTLRHADKIKAFEAERLAQKPLLAHSMLA